ncbi:MAG: HEAT repeat domain-containing protein [Candidatus Acidiferrales bacterium]
MRKTASTILIAACIGLFVLQVLAQTQISALFRQLESRKTTDSAAAQLLQLGRSDPKARHYLAIHLPPLIAGDHRPETDNEFIRRQWVNAVVLAGNLKLAEAVPTLANQIDVRSTPLNRNTDSPARWALCRIGDPAVPSVQRLLNDGNQEQRISALEVLEEMDSPKAMAALRDYGKSGKDPWVVDRVRIYFQSRPTVERGPDCM